MLEIAKPKRSFKFSSSKHLTLPLLEDAQILGNYFLLFHYIITNAIIKKEILVVEISNLLILILIKIIDNESVIDIRQTGN